MGEEDDVVTAGGGPGEGFADLWRHVVPIAVFLTIMTAGILYVLISKWPHCELYSCAPNRVAKSRVAPIAPAPSADPAAPPLSITAVNPTNGTICGGIPVTIGGTGFAPGPVEVRFGGVSALSTELSRDQTAIIATTPPHWESAVDVTVSTPDKSATVTKSFNYVCPERTQSRLLLLVVLAGALGGVLHALRSLFHFVGNRTLRVSWLPMYVLLPFTGAAISTVFFLVFVAGFFSPQGGDGQSFFLMVGVSALVGMFSPQAVEKLKKISEAILTSAAPAADKAPTALALTRVQPEIGPLNQQTGVTLTGKGFMPGAKVTFGGAHALNVKVVSGTEISTEAPARATAGKVDVNVTNPDGGKAGIKGGFEYK